MELEYILWLRRKMDSALQQLVQADEKLKEAKRQGKDKKRYEQQIKEAARQACEVDPAAAPTVAFLWLRACYRGLEDHIRDVWSPFLNEESICNQLLDHASLHTSKYWRIALDFTLRKPYLSKDDTDFYILDNPVRKEWVFQVPYIAPSQWKGALRAAMRRRRGYTSWEQEAQDEQMIRLFGNVKGEENEFSAGWLHFYPTYFDRIGPGGHQPP